MNVNKHDRFMSARSITFDDLSNLMKVSLNLQRKNILNGRFCSIPFIQGGPGVGKTEYMMDMIKRNQFSLNKDQFNVFINLKEANEVPHEIITMIPRYLACLL